MTIAASVGTVIERALQPDCSVLLLGQVLGCVTQALTKAATLPEFTFDEAVQTQLQRLLSHIGDSEILRSGAIYHQALQQSLKAALDELERLPLNGTLSIARLSLREKLNGENRYTSPANWEAAPIVTTT